MGEADSDRLQASDGSALSMLREHVSELQMAQVAHDRRAIILFEGPAVAGKKAALKQLAAAFDPCHFAVHAVRHDRRQSSEGHWLGPLWRPLPQDGDTADLFLRWAH